MEEVEEGEKEEEKLEEGRGRRGERDIKRGTREDGGGSVKEGKMKE